MLSRRMVIPMVTKRVSIARHSFVVKYGEEVLFTFFFSPDANDEDKDAFPRLSKAISATESFVSAFDTAASSGLSGENHAKGSGFLLTFETLDT